MVTWLGMLSKWLLTVVRGMVGQPVVMGHGTGVELLTWVRWRRMVGIQLLLLQVFLLLLLLQQILLLLLL